jgi:hypothetical protein
LADLDGDGIDDLITGSYSPGNIYVYKGKGHGEFEAGQMLKDDNGKDIVLGNASVAAPIDWNGNGKPDLIVGFISGKMKHLVNKGNMRFGSPEDVLAGGAPIEGNNVSPCVADWDGDGVPDLITGDANGIVTFYKGTRTSNGLTFAPGVELVGPTTFPNPADRPAFRAKVCVADWNGDGKLDLIVGDFSSAMPTPKNLTAAQKKRLKELQAQQREMSAKLGPIYTAMAAKVAKQLGFQPTATMTTEQSAKYSAAIQKEMASNKPFQDLERKYSALYQELAPLQGLPKTDGFVRVYLRK